MQRSLNNWHNQISSLVVAARAWYSASADKRETVDCFLDFQEINESPRKIQKPVMDLLESQPDA